MDVFELYEQTFLLAEYNKALDGIIDAKIAIIAYMEEELKDSDVLIELKKKIINEKIESTQKSIETVAEDIERMLKYKAAKKKNNEINKMIFNLQKALKRTRSSSPATSKKQKIIGDDGRHAEATSPPDAVQSAENMPKDEETNATNTGQNNNN